METTGIKTETPMEANTWKGTKDESKVLAQGGDVFGTSYYINGTWETLPERTENAKLFTDALKTIQKCGKMPSELLEHNELLKQQLGEAKKKIPF